MSDVDRSEYDLAAGALEGSVFRMLRQGQRVIFELDDEDHATRIQIGSEVDMGTPGFASDGTALPADHDDPAGSVPTA